MDYDTNPVQKQDMQEVRRDNRLAARDKAFDEVFNLTNKGEQKWQGQPISVGQIADMEIPQKWFEGRKQDNVQGNSSYREFRGGPPDGGLISFFDRGSALSDASAEKFKNLLSKPAGAVKREELGALVFELLGRNADPANYKINSISVENLNGKKVLEINGRYPDPQSPPDMDSKRIFISTMPNGRFVQEIELQSAATKTAKLKPTFDKMLKSIKWQ